MNLKEKKKTSGLIFVLKHFRSKLDFLCIYIRQHHQIQPSSQSGASCRHVSLTSTQLDRPSPGPELRLLLGLDVQAPVSDRASSPPGAAGRRFNLPLPLLRLSQDEEERRRRGGGDNR